MWELQDSPLQANALPNERSRDWLWDRCAVVSSITRALVQIACHRQREPCPITAGERETTQVRSTDRLGLDDGASPGIRQGDLLAARYSPQPVGDFPIFKGRTIPYPSGSGSGLQLDWIDDSRRRATVQGSVESRAILWKIAHPAAFRRPLGGAPECCPGQDLLVRRPLLDPLPDRLYVLRAERR